MNPRRTKSIAWTVGLVMLLALAALLRFAWLSLLVPGAILTWYGVVAAPPAGKNGLRNHGRTGLN
jgi:hypothetical protein